MPRERRTRDRVLEPIREPRSSPSRAWRGSASDVPLSLTVNTLTAIRKKRSTYCQPSLRDLCWMASRLPRVCHSSGWFLRIA